MMRYILSCYRFNSICITMLTAATLILTLQLKWVVADSAKCQDECNNASVVKSAEMLESANNDDQSQSMHNKKVKEMVDQPKQKNMRRHFRLQSEEQVDELMKSLSETPHTDDLQIQTVRLKTVPDGLLERMANCTSDTKSLILTVGHLSPGETAPEISDLGMEHISQLRELKTLCLAGRFSAKGFAYLSNLTELETLGLDYPTITTKDFFTTVSKLPKIRTIGVRYADFSQPIDAATYKAIASLNGRLESLSFGEWGETTIDRSMIPAIAEIESLTSLELGNFYGVTAEDMEPIKKKLPYLSIFGPTTKDTAGVLTVGDYCLRDRCPVQFREVESPTAMIVLLQFILGEIEADKVRREVVRRRAGLAQKEDFTESGLGLASILRNSFGVTVYPNARSTLNQIPHSYPELNKAIRRYLSGKQLTPSD